MRPIDSLSPSRRVRPAIHSNLELQLGESEIHQENSMLLKLTLFDLIHLNNLCLLKTIVQLVVVSVFK